MMNKLMLEMKVMSLIKDIKRDCEDICDYITNCETKLDRDDIINCLSEIDGNLDDLDETIMRIEEEFEKEVIRNEKSGN